MKSARLLILVLVIQPIFSYSQLPAFSSRFSRIEEIPVPPGFERVHAAPGSFGAYLQQLPLRKNRTVFLYNGQPKADQSLHYAVIDISTGSKDLQQCADLIMRLRAEYFFERGKYDSILFRGSDHDLFRYSDWKKKCSLEQHVCLMAFMEQVFMYCGTYSLAQQLRSKRLSEMQIGDVLIKGGSPGHAEIVADMAIDRKTGKKIFMLAESYMPAQDAHLVLNPVKPSFGPWYELNDENKIFTATWIFTSDQLRYW
ncbi:MAG: hypothetical protein JO301_13605 [Chitinophagaceae bacterium]|nr:hypothetical protein [Chitinophagaceae bacterium]